MKFKETIKTKQQAFNLFESNQRDFLDYARLIAYKICKENGQVTVDDVRKIVSLPYEIDGRIFGAVFKGKEWKKVGYTQTQIRSSHGRPISVFKLA